MRPAPRRWVRGVVFLMAAAVLTVLASPVAAHDLWVLPGKFHLAPDELTRVFVNSGDVFPESLTLTGEHRLVEAALYGPKGKRDVSAFRVEGKSLTFDLAAGGDPGTLVIGIGLRPRHVRLRAADFEDYLELEGLSAMTALREALGESEEATVERYTKWAKAIVRIGARAGAGTGETGGTAWKEPVGHRLEIVPLVDPSALARGDALPFRLLFDGSPVKDVPVVAGHTGGETRAVETVTGLEGEAEIPLAESGRWYVRALHMERREDDPEVKWESFWCTLTFEVASPAPEPSHESVRPQRR